MIVKLTSGLWGLKPESIEAQLNSLGLQGGELVAAKLAGMTFLAYLRNELS